MNELVSRSPELSGNYQVALESITGRPLIPEYIDSYAEDALNDLISLVQDCTDSYREQAIITDDESPKEIEEAAFSYYKLGNIEPILDHIADKSKEIKQLDNIIAEAVEINQVITPPDALEPISTNGNGTFEEKKTIPRLKTVLFILSNDFDTDINSQDEVSITRGVVTNDMMRRTSYHLVEAHKLDKSILVCDEEGNATYVLDTSQLTRAGIQSGDLLQLSKAELNHLIEQEPLLGQRLVYSQSYVSSVINSLQQLTGNNSIKPIDIEAQGKYLYPRAPADILSIRGIAKALVIDHKTATRAINMLGDQLGETGIYRFGTHNIVGYSLEQQAWIAAQLEANGAFAEKAPEGYMSVGGIADELDVSHLAVTRAINMLGDQLGETGIYRFRQQKVTGYSLEQQAWIVAQLESNGLFTEKAPEDYLSLQGLADSLNVSDSIVAGVIEVLGDQLGETGIYKFGSNATVGYSTEQQAKIAAQLEANGAFAEKAPEGYLSIKGIAKAWNIDNTAVGRARKMIGDQLGAAESYKFGSNATVGYSLEQQAWIVAQLESNGLFTDKAPEDYLSLQGLANALGVSPGGVSIAIKMLGDQLGETGIYRFNQQNATGYSLEQQAWIAAQLEANGAFAEKAPEGYMSVGGIADSLGIGDSTVKRAIRMLGDELGKVEIRRFGSRSVTGYSQEQQAKIAAQLEANGHFTV